MVLPLVKNLISVISVDHLLSTSTCSQSLLQSNHIHFKAPLADGNGSKPCEKSRLEKQLNFLWTFIPRNSSVSGFAKSLSLTTHQVYPSLVGKKKNMSFLSESHFFFGILKLDTPVCSAALRLEIYTLYDMGSWMETSGMVETAPKRWEKAIAGWLMIIYG